MKPGRPIDPTDTRPGYYIELSEEELYAVADHHRRKVKRIETTLAKKVLEKGIKKYQTKAYVNGAKIMIGAHLSRADDLRDLAKKGPTHG